MAGGQNIRLTINMELLKEAKDTIQVRTIIIVVIEYIRKFF